MAKKPSLAEALGGMKGPSKEEYSEDGSDAAMYVKDIDSALKSKDAQALYDVICAIVKAHGSGGEISIVLG